MSLSKSQAVVFVTTVFEGVDTGPGIYAHYLWNAFRDDTETEFHIVAPKVAERHPRLHSAGAGSGSFDLYRRVQAKALEVVNSLSGRAILHGNSTHGMSMALDYQGPLIVQVNDYETALLPVIALDVARESGLRKMLSTAWRYQQERRVLARSDLALCNSEYTAKVVSKAYRITDTRFRVVYKSVDTAAFERPVVLPSDPIADCAPGKRLVFVGSGWQGKGLDVLLDAVKLLRSKHPDLTLVAIGPDPQDARLRSLLHSTDLFSAVVLAGKVSRELLARHLWHSDMLVLPTRREALGVAVLEGMAAGLPIVATRVGGIPEVVREGVDGLLVHPENVTDLCEAIGYLLSEPTVRESMGKAGAGRARDFSVAVMVDAVRDVYRELSRGSS